MFRDSFRRRRDGLGAGARRRRGGGVDGRDVASGGSAGGMNARTCASEVRSFMNIRYALFLFSSVC